MRRPQGYAVWSGPKPLQKERDTVTCKHCQRVVIVDPGTSPASAGGWCGRCDGYICGRCAGEMDKTLKCRPFEERLERAEARGRALRSMGL